MCTAAKASAPSARVIRKTPAFSAKIVNGCEGPKYSVSVPSWPDSAGAAAMMSPAAPVTTSSCPRAKAREGIACARAAAGSVLSEPLNVPLRLPVTTAAVNSMSVKASVSVRSYASRVITAVTATSAPANSATMAGTARCTQIWRWAKRGAAVCVALRASPCIAPARAEACAESARAIFGPLETDRSDVPHLSESISSKSHFFGLSRD